MHMSFSAFLTLIISTQFPVDTVWSQHIGVEDCLPSFSLPDALCDPTDFI